MPSPPPLTAQQWVQLTPDIPVENGNFGSDVATQGSSAFVGHPKDGINHTGEVEVYELQSGSWINVATLSPGALSGAPDEFGSRLAIDGSTLVIGAPSNDDAGYDSSTGQPLGAVFVYRKEPTGWVLDDKILPPPAATNVFHFGVDVDIDGDGLVIGSQSVGNNNLAPSGRAFVFRRGPLQWTFAAELVPHPVGGMLVNCYGESVSIYQNRILVGASETIDPVTVSRPGAVFTFTRVGETWVEGTPLFPPPPESSAAHFGFAVDQDGRYAVIGAYGFYLDLRGTAFGYTLTPSDNWQIDAEIGDTVTSTGDAFGWSISLSAGSLDVGCPGKTVYGVDDVGGSHQFDFDGSNWLPLPVVDPPSAGAQGKIGIAVCRDVFLISGAPFTDFDSIDSAGAAYVSLPE